MSTATAQHQTPPQLPLGCIRIHDGRRRIKISLDGPHQKRWMNYSRFLWIQKHGAIPIGKLIVHMDGDSLVDDTRNLALGDPGDALWLWCERQGESLLHLHRKNAAHLTAAVRARWTAFRMKHIMRSFWYPVDVASHVVINRPQRRQLQVIRDCGVEVRPEDWQRAVAAALGWPLLTNCQAGMLHVLAAGVPLRGVELRQRCAEVLRPYGVTKLITSRDGMYRSLERMPAGYVTSRRVGRRSVYSIGELALAQRLQTCPFVPMWGASLLEPPYNTFELRDDARVQ